jgi:hypothetical protein
MSALAVLRPDALTVVYTDRPAVAGGAIPQSAVADMEVISEPELIATIEKCVPKNASGMIPTILAISDELCFTQPFEGKSKENAEKLLISLTPFSEIATTVFSAKNQEYVIATNQELYESVARALGQQNHQVVLVVPWMNMRQMEIVKNAIDKEAAKKAHDEMSTLRLFGFPYVQDIALKSVSIVPGITKGPATFSWGWVVFLVIAGVYAFVMYWFFIRGAS